MTAVPSPALAGPSVIRLGRSWFYVGMAVFAMLFCIAAFGPSVMDRSGRLGSLTPAVAVHAVVFFSWLAIFLTQSILARTGGPALHRRIGLASAILAAAVVGLGYQTTIAMARRGFDLSGDL